MTWTPINSRPLDPTRLPQTWLTYLDPKTRRIVVTGNTGDRSADIVASVIYVEFANDPDTNIDIRREFAALLASMLTRATSAYRQPTTARHNDAATDGAQPEGDLP